MELTTDNGSKNKIWSRKGDKVKIISVSGNAVIYENKSGERFPCNKKILK